MTPPAAEGGFTSLDELERHTRAELASYMQHTARGEPVVLAGYCAHRNVGDNLLNVAEDCISISGGVAIRQRVTTAATNWGSGVAVADGRGAIFLHSGGNIGDLYPNELQQRVAIITRFQRSPILSLPQTVHFQDARNAEPFRRAVARHPDFTFLARDRVTFEWAQTNLDCRSELVPDAALALPVSSRPSQPTRQVLALLRDDIESDTAGRQVPRGVMRRDWVLPAASYLYMTKVAGAAWDRAARHSSIGERAAPGLSARRVAKAANLLSSAQIVVTDRLHGVILCMLNSIPVIAVDNSYGKLTRVLRTWDLEELADIHLVDDLGQAFELAAT